MHDVMTQPQTKEVKLDENKRDHIGNLNLNLIYCFAGAISSTEGELSALTKKKSYIIGRVKGRLRLVIQSCGCDQEGRRLSWETGVKEVGFEVFPERCIRGAISYFEGEGVPKNQGIVTERIGKVFTENNAICFRLF